MSVTDELVPVLKKLRLSGVLRTLDLRTREAADGELSHSDFLFRVCCDEIQRRDTKQLEQRLRRASFDSTKRLEDFEWAFNPKVPKARLLELATCSFVERRENVLLVGPTGVGKSHLAQALGERACRAGHAVGYVAAHRMLATLRASRADQSYEKKLLRFTTPDLLIIDDLGLRPLAGDEPIDLYEVSSDCSSRSSSRCGGSSSLTAAESCSGSVSAAWKSPRRSSRSLVASMSSRGPVSLALIAPPPPARRRG